MGELIGSQAEIYESTPRQFPIYIHYPHLMKRRILLEVPAGYKVLNLNDLNIKSVFENNGKRTMGFESSYAMDKTLVTIDIIEDYREVYYPLDQYLPFQKIINAAADFNKVVLVLEKEIVIIITLQVRGILMNNQLISVRFQHLAKTFCWSTWHQWFWRFFLFWSVPF